MGSLQTDWLNVAREGMTMDGREIFAQDLIDMADNYDPDIYSAQINYNHYSSWRMGKVLELKTITDKHSKIRLQARLAPSIELCKMNASQQAVHFSIEICPDFQATGKAYLDGLAVTDAPASTGTSELKLFSRTKGNYFGYPEEVTLFDDQSVVEHFLKSASEKDESKNFSFKNLFKSKTPENHSKNEGEDDMTPEQQAALISGMGEAFASALKPVTEKLGDLDEKFSKFGADEEAEEKPEDKDGDADTKAVSAESFAKLQADHEALQEKFNKAERFTKDNEDFADDDSVEGVI